MAGLTLALVAMVQVLHSGGADAVPRKIRFIGADEVVIVGQIGGDSLAFAHVANVLDRAGIWWTHEGGMGGGFRVRKADEKRARDSLAGAGHLYGWVWLKGTPEITPPTDHLNLEPVGLPLRSALSVSKRLSTVFETAIGQQDVRTLLRENPFVIDVCYIQRWIASVHGGFSYAENGVVGLSRSAKGHSASARFAYVLVDGRAWVWPGHSVTIERLLSKER